MKKVTILSLHLGFGGIERSVASLANMLKDNYEVEIMSVYKLYDKPGFYIDKKIKIKYLLPDLKPNRAEFKQAVKKLSITGIFKEGIKAIKILQKRKSETINFIESCNSDIIISTRDIFNEWLGEVKKDNVLKIGWEHNHHHGNMDYARKIIKSCKNLDYLVLVSNSLKEFYSEKMRNKRCKCIFIPNVIEEIPTHSSKLTEKRMISVGRLSKEKGFMDLLKIYKHLRNEYPNWKLDIIGSGDEEEYLKKFIVENNLETNVTLHGFRERDYIFDLLSKSSIYLMTSYTESFGLVLIEAMSVGVPCIAFSSAEGANEIIQSGYNGYLIKNRNMEAYEQKIRDLIGDEETRKRIGHNAKKSVAKYKSNVVVKDWLELLEKSKTRK